MVLVTRDLAAGFTLGLVVGPTRDLAAVHIPDPAAERTRDLAVARTLGRAELVSMDLVVEIVIHGTAPLLIVDDLAT